MQYFNNLETTKIELTEKALTDFGPGIDFNILADFIGDLIYSGSDVWDVYDQYFDHDIYDCNSSAPRKRWAYGICKELAGEYPDEEDITPETRHHDNRKDNYPAPHTSCFRKGYHKSERDWKKSERRNNRREGRKLVANYDGKEVR